MMIVQLGTKKAMLRPAGCLPWARARASGLVSGHISQYLRWSWGQIVQITSYWTRSISYTIFCLLIKMNTMVWENEQPTTYRCQHGQRRWMFEFLSPDCYLKIWVGKETTVQARDVIMSSLRVCLLFTYCFLIFSTGGLGTWCFSSHHIYFA